MRQRIDAIHEALARGLPHIHVEVEHLFNKPRPIARVSGKNKTAERKIKEGKYSIATNILKTLDTPFTEPHNSAHVLNCLKKLTPPVININGNDIDGYIDLSDFVSNHALDHEDRANQRHHLLHSSEHTCYLTSKLSQEY